MNDIMHDTDMEALRARMKREDACHRRARKYSVLHKIGLWTAILLGVGCLSLPIFWVWRALLWLSSILLTFVWTLLVQQRVRRILTHEMDPLCYLTVIDKLNMKSKYGTEEIMGLVADGRYREAIAFAEQKMPKVKDSFLKTRLRYDALRARFRLGDLEGMAEQIGIFEEIFEKEDPKGILFKGYGPVIETYKSFLAEDFIACKAYRSRVLSEEKGKTVPYAEVTLDYVHGVYSYYNREPYIAKTVFKAVAEQAPLTAEGRLAVTFLKVMEESEEPVALCEIARRTF